MHQGANEILIKYNEACLAAREFEKTFSCLAAGATDGSGGIFVWTHASFIKKVAYYPFRYKFLDTHAVIMVYANTGNQYVMPIYHE